MTPGFRNFLFSILLIAPLVAAQTADTAGAPACNSKDTKFSVRTEKQKNVAQPESGKALVYFIEDDSDFASFPKPTTRIGLDGTWLGATHGSSYLYFTVAPGVHHVCSEWQSAVIMGKPRQIAAVHFAAEPGNIYYFRVKNSYWSHDATVEMSLHFIDSDEGQLLASKLPVSISHPK